MKHILSFLEELEINNKREWFHAHQEEYQSVRKQVLALAQKLIDAVSNFYELPYDMKPGDCIFRINRDTRFSKDKTPYKTNFGIEISQGGKRQWDPCFYLHIQPGNNSFIAGGLYMPDSKVTEIIRKWITEDGKKFQKIIDKVLDGNKFYIYEEAVKTAPRGYKKDSPYIEFIKLKHRIVEKTLKDSELLSKDFEKNVVKSFEKIEPLVSWLQDILVKEYIN